MDDINLIFQVKYENNLQVSAIRPLPYYQKFSITSIFRIGRSHMLNHILRLYRTNAMFADMFDIPKIPP